MLTRIFPSTPSIEGFPKFPFHPPEACCAPLQMSALFIYFMDFYIYWQKKSLSDEYCWAISSPLFYLVCSVSVEFSPLLVQSIVIPDSPLGSTSLEKVGIRWSKRWRCIAGSRGDDSTAAPPLPPAAMSQMARFARKSFYSLQLKISSKQTCHLAFTNSWGIKRDSKLSFPPSFSPLFYTAISLSLKPPWNQS